MVVNGASRRLFCASDCRRSSQVCRHPNDATLDSCCPKLPFSRAMNQVQHQDCENYWACWYFACQRLPFWPGCFPSGWRCWHQLNESDFGHDDATTLGMSHYHTTSILLGWAESSPFGTHSLSACDVPVDGSSGEDGVTSTDPDVCRGHSGDAGSLGYHHHTNVPEGMVPGPGQSFEVGVVVILQVASVWRTPKSQIGKTTLAYRLIRLQYFCNIATCQTPSALRPIECSKAICSYI